MDRVRKEVAVGRRSSPGASGYRARWTQGISFHKQMEEEQGLATDPRCWEMGRDSEEVPRGTKRR